MIYHKYLFLAPYYLILVQVMHIYFWKIQIWQTMQMMAPHFANYGNNYKHLVMLNPIDNAPDI